MSAKKRKLDNGNDKFVQNIGDVTKKPPKKRIVTEGGTNLQYSVQILSYIQEISETLCEVLNSYINQLKNEDDYHVIYILKDANEILNEDIQNTTKLQKKKKNITTLIYESKADYRLNNKDWSY